jgi:hypothetical protein
MTTPSDEPPAGGFGTKPGAPMRRIAGPPARSRVRGTLVVIALFTVALAGTAFVACERRIQVIADDQTIIIKAVPGDDVTYRLSDQQPFVRALDDDGQMKGYLFRVPVPVNARPKSGVLPIQINYRTWIGLRRTTWVSLDVDEEQLRYFFMAMWSGGWNGVARFDGVDRVRIDAPNERCIRWRYGFDGAAPTLELAEGARELAVPASVALVTFKPALCKKAPHVCTLTISRSVENPTRTCD